MIVDFALGKDGRPVVEGWRATGFVILRVWVGLAIAVHGFSAVSDTSAMEGFVSYLEKLELPMPLVSAWAGKLTEFLGGMMLACGALTRPVCLALSITMAVAVFMAHGSDPFFAKPGDPSKEMAMLYLVPFVAFFIMGPGPSSVDGLLHRFIGPRAS